MHQTPASGTVPDLSDADEPDLSVAEGAAINPHADSSEGDPGSVSPAALCLVAHSQDYWPKLMRCWRLLR